MIMRNFMLLESETDHTGSTRTGPLATYDKTYRGVNYFHVRRVYRDQHGQWAPGYGISCPYEQRDALLAALLKCLAKQRHVGKASGTLAKPAARGLTKAKPVEPASAA